MGIIPKAGIIQEWGLLKRKFTICLLLGILIPIMNSGILVLNSILNFVIENWEMPVFQKQKMAIFGKNYVC